MGRSGRPSYSDSWVDQVNWQAGTLMILYVVASLVIHFRSLMLVKLIPCYVSQIIPLSSDWAYNGMENGNNKIPHLEQ